MLSSIRDFRLLWLGGLLANLGSQMSAVALPMLVMRQTGSAVQASAVSSVSIAALLITLLPGGAVADTVERRRLMMLCELGSTLVVASLAIAVLVDWIPLFLILLVAMIGTVIGSLYGPAALGLLRTVVPEDLLGTASSRMQARGAAARLVGPLVGGALYAVHPVLPFTAEAAGLLLSALCLAFVRSRSMPRPSSASPFAKKELTAGVAFIWRRPFLRTVLLVFGLGMNAAFSAATFVALATGSDTGKSGLGGGTIVSLTAAGSLTGALLGPKVPSRLHPGVLIAGTCWVFTVAAGLFMISQQPLYVGAICALIMAVASATSISFLTLLVLSTPQELTGRVQSAAGLVSSLAQPLGPMLGGLLLSAWGARAAYGAVGLVFFTCAVVMSTAPSVRSSPVPSGKPRTSAP